MENEMNIYEDEQLERKLNDLTDQAWYSRAGYVAGEPEKDKSRK